MWNDSEACSYSSNVLVIHMYLTIRKRMLVRSWELLSDEDELKDELEDYFEADYNN